MPFTRLNHPLRLGTGNDIRKTYWIWSIPHKIPSMLQDPGSLWLTYQVFKRLERLPVLQLWSTPSSLELDNFEWYMTPMEQKWMRRRPWIFANIVSLPSSGNGILAVNLQINKIIARLLTLYSYRWKKISCNLYLEFWINLYLTTKLPVIKNCFVEYIVDLTKFSSWKENQMIGPTMSRYYNCYNYQCTIA